MIAPAPPGPTPVLARAAPPAKPPTVDTYLGLRSLGEAGVSPDARSVVIQVRAPASTGRSFDDETLLDAQLSRLVVWDVGTVKRPPARARTSLAALPGPFSPSGARMAVLRVHARALQLGVLTLASGRVRWWPVEVEAPGLGRSVQWRSDAELAVLAPAPGAVAQRLETGAAAQARAARLWARQRGGRRAAVTEPYAAPAFVDGPRRLLVVSARTGRVRTLARGAISDFEFSPDGGRAALLIRAERRPLASAGSLTVSQALRRTALALVDLGTGRSFPACPGRDLMPTLLRWRDDGGALAVAARDPRAFTWDRAELLSVSPTGTCQSLDPGGAQTPGLDHATDERLPAFPAVWRGEVLWARRPEAAGAVTWKAWRGGRLLPSPGPPPAQSAPEPFAEAARLALSSPPSPVAPAGGEPTPIAARTLPSGGEVTLRARVSPAGVTDVVLETPWGRRRLERLNPQLERVRWAQVVPVVAGRRRHWLYLPRGAAPPPLVVLPYPGASYDAPPDRYAPGSTSLVTQAQLLAAHGYAALVPSLPAPEPGRADAGVAAAVLAAVDAAERTGRVDVRRTAVWGHSFGGYAALIAAEASPRFRAVVAEHASVDPLSFRGVLPAPARAFADPERYAEFFFGWSEAGQGGFGVPPTRGADAYLEADAAIHADRITAPVLLVSGDQDFVVPGQAEEMAAALLREDRPFRLLTFWGEGHTLLSPANLRAFYSAVFSFLDGALGTPESAASRDESSSRTRAGDRQDTSPNRFSGARGVANSSRPCSRLN